MSLQTALTALAQIPVTGVQSYGINQLPQTLQRADLPCLLVVPLALPDLSLSVSTEGLTPGTFAQGSTHAHLNVLHLLLLTTVQGGAPISLFLPRLVSHVDDVLAAYAADPTLGSSLAEPAQVRVEMGVFDWGGSHYYGCAFWHQWLLRLEVVP